ncbi:MAG TPA: DUF433 domain-containing protein [Thermomicrobiales bacterium]|jgi:uncharacterized protein (DUF433 family)|nr:DUF433 domain-containing protein [Thermomicrobiales bacterium]
MVADVVRSVLVSRDPEVHSGDAVFVGTRVPADTLVDYLLGGNTLDEFLDDYPSVKREQAVAALEILREVLLAK